MIPPKTPVPGIPRLAQATLLLVAGALLGRPAQAQVAFRAGPRVGLALAHSAFRAQEFASGTRNFNTTVLAGLEAGVMAQLTMGRVLVQPALLFAQRGFRVDDNYVAPLSNAVTKASLRLNYLTLPVSVGYALRADGQGLQLFAGPYVGLLLGGTYDYKKTFAGYRRQTIVVEGSVPVEGSGPYHNGVTDVYQPINRYYSRKVDFGLQAGVGYCRGNSLIQLGYSLGLQNMGVGERFDYGAAVGVYTSPIPTYRSHAVQASFTYLLGPKR